MPNGTYDTPVASHKLLIQLALAKNAPKAAKQTAPKPQEVEIVEREVPADTQREVANAVAKDAMVMGWDRAIQKHAYENRIPEAEVVRLLDAALAYNDKADPPGRIDELEDWKHEKRGSSTLKAKN